MTLTEQELESVLWSSANILRGQLGDSYTSSLIGLLFYKILSDRSHVSSNSPELVDHDWLLPEPHRWPANTYGSSDYFFSQLFHSMQVDPQFSQLGNLLITLGVDKLLRITELRNFFESLDLSDLDNDVTSIAIERFMEKTAQISRGKAGLGVYFTPSNIAMLLAELLAPPLGTSIYDPTCGIGNLFLAIHRYQKYLHTDESLTQYFGQEKNTDAALIAQINLILSGIARANIQAGSALTEPQFFDASHQKLREFDYVISSLPFGALLTWDEINSLKAIPYANAKYSALTRSADTVYVQHILSTLSNAGRAALLVVPSMLMRASTESDIRKQIIEADYVEAVISLPSGLLHGANIGVAILVLNKNKPAHLKDRVTLVYADNNADANRQHPLDTKHREEIVQAARGLKPKRNFSITVTTKQIQENNYVLTPARYFIEVPHISFLGRKAEWKKLGDLSDILMGILPTDRNKSDEGTPIIRGRDLSRLNLKREDLAKVDLSDQRGRLRSAQLGDILIQRIGQHPIAIVVGNDLESVVVHQTVLVIRLHSSNREFAPYLVDFLNSDTGQNWLSAHTRGPSIPTLSVIGLRELQVPLPDLSVQNMLDKFRAVEQNLVEQLEQTRELRQSIFSLEDAEQASIELLRLSSRAQFLASVFAQADDPDFQVKNFYPFPLAFPYRMLNSVTPDAMLYKEQLRLAENILGFMGIITLSLIGKYAKELDKQNSSIRADLLTYLQRGISPGHWVSIIRNGAKLLRGVEKSPIAASIGSLMVKGATERTSKFADLINELVQKKNDFKHDRGPNTPDQLGHAVSDLAGQLRECFEYLTVFAQYPIHLVERARVDWRTNRAMLDTTVYIGDHQAMPKAQIEVPSVLPEQHLYLRISDNEWLSLYPLLTVQFCPSCQLRETYFVERYDGNRAYLKSFERGHVIENTPSSKTVGDDLKDYLQEYF